MLASCWVFCMDPRVDSGLCCISHKLIGTDWSLISSRLRFVFKRLLTVVETFLNDTYRSPDWCVVQRRTGCVACKPPDLNEPDFYVTILKRLWCCGRTAVDGRRLMRVLSWDARNFEFVRQSLMGISALCVGAREQHFEQFCSLFVLKTVTSFRSAVCKWRVPCGRI
jgi:hypothetical protein